MRVQIPSSLKTRHVVQATLIILAVVFGFWLLYSIRLALFILFVAIVISTALRPFVDWLHRRGLSHTLAGMIVYLCLLAIVTGLTLLLAVPLLEQITTVVSQIPDYYKTIRSSLLSSPNLIMQQLAWPLPPTLSFTAPEASPDQETATGVAQGLEYYLDFIFKGAFITIATVLLSVYWTQGGRRATKTMLLLLPINQRETAKDLLKAMEDKVGAYIRGQTILCAVVGVMALVAYLLIGLPYALLLALIAGILEAVPLVGPVLGAVPAILIAATLDPTKILWVIAATLIIQQLENTLLFPRIMDRSVGVHPVVSLLALFAFGSLFGIAGALLAIPIAAIIQQLLNYFIFSNSLDEPLEERNRLAVLRYEVRDLVQDLRKQVRPGEEEVVDGTEPVEEELEAIAADLDRLLTETQTAGAES